MRYVSCFIFLFFLALLFSCSSENSSAQPVEGLTKIDSAFIKDSLFKLAHIKDYDLGDVEIVPLDDINADGISDTAIIYPLTFFVHHEQIDSQYVNIRISCFPKLIKHIDGFSGVLVSVADLDGDKINEFAYCPDWYQSAWAGIFIYGYSENTWKLYGSGSIRRDFLYDSDDPSKYLKDRVKKINNKSFQIVNSILRENGDFGDSTITISIP